MKLGVAQVVDVNARAQDPAPGLEALDVGQLLDGLVLAGLGPEVMHKALSVCRDLVGKGLEHRLAGRVLDAAAILAVQLGLDRMHDDIGPHVIDPEVLRAAVAHF